jgi:hypothetical protein
MTESAIEIYALRDELVAAFPGIQVRVWDFKSQISKQYSVCAEYMKYSLGLTWQADGRYNVGYIKVSELTLDGADAPLHMFEHYQDAKQFLFAKLRELRGN